MVGLEPDDEVYITARRMEEGWDGPAVWSEARLKVCKRCGSVVWDWGQHVAWHGSVDSSATTKLAGD
jgi:hypothetical protein